MITQTAPVETSGIKARSASSGTAPQRSLLVDVLKGLAIVLMTLGHVNQGLLREHAWHTGFGEALDRYIYSFHMPAFFFSAGIFLCGSLEKRGLAHFLRSRVKSLLWPFLIWGAILDALVPVLLPRLVHAPALPARAWAWSVVTGNAQWFLPSLFVASVLAALLVRVPVPLLFGLSWMVSLFWHPVGAAILDRPMELLPFLVAGMWMGPRFEFLEALAPWQCIPLAAVLGYVILQATTPLGLQALYWGFVPVGLMGTLLLLLVGRMLSQTVAARFMASLGVASLGIFLLSPFGQGTGRLLLHLAHVQNPAVNLGVATLVATLPTAWIYHHRERLRIGWMFVWPG